MGKMYTFDSKLLCGSPEIRIGEKVYPVDDRKNTVKKAMELFSEKSESMDTVEKLFELAFGKKNAAEIEALDMSFKAFQKLSELVMNAMTGEEPDEADKADSFRKEQE